ncbi:MAG: hypothetical protein ACREA3_06695 [Nitrosotalea sp.]
MTTHISRVMKDLKDLYKRIDSRTAKYGKISEEEIRREVKRYRTKKRSKPKT